MLVLSSQARLLGSNPVVWLCDQEPVRTFQKGPPPEKAKLRRWWTYLSQLRLTVHHIQGVNNECADYISRNNFDALIGARSEALAKEAFSRMDVHSDLIMTMIRPLDGLQQSEYLKELGDIYEHLEKRLEPLLVNQEQWKRDKSYLCHEDRIVVPSDRVPAQLKWTYESSGHVGADRTLRLFKQWFHTTWTDDQLRKTLQPIVDKCPCRSCKPGDIRDRGLYWTLPIPHCARRPRTPYTQHHTQSVHTGEQEPGGPGHRTRNTTHRACAPVNRSQEAQDAVHATPHTERAHR